MAKRHDFKSKEPSGLLGGMQAFLSRKKQEAVENMTGFLSKLEEVDKKLKVSQERLEREMKEE